MCLVLFLPFSNVAEALMLAICVRFCYCLCKVCSQKLPYSLCGLCLSLYSSSDNKASLRSQAPQQQYTVLFLFFDVKAWPKSQTDLLTYTTILHFGYTFLRCIDLLHSIVFPYGITLWAYLPEPLVKDSHKHLSSTEKTTIPCAPSHVITHYHYIRVKLQYVYNTSNF